MEQKCEVVYGEKVAHRSPQRAKTREQGRNGINAESFRRKGRKKLTLDNEGAMDTHSKMWLWRENGSPMARILTRL